jgi:hypothetical protein
VGANGRRGAHRSGRAPRVRRIFTGGDEDDQPELVVGADQLRVLRDDFEANLAKLFDGHADVEPHVTQRPREAAEMIVQPKELVAKRPRHFGDGGSQHHAGVVNRQVRLRRGNGAAIEVDDGFVHCIPISFDLTDNTGGA